MTYDLFVLYIADYAVIPVVLIGGWALLSIPKGQRYQAYCRVLLSALTAFLLAKLVATLYQPALERPYLLMGVEPGASALDNPGFPSDHALFVTTVVAAVWLETRRPIVTLVLGVLALAVCVGRVLAFVHTPADVIAGALLAIAAACAWHMQRGIQPRTIKNNHKRTIL